MAEISEWYDFAEQLRATATRMFDHLEKQIEPVSRIYALALLGRTISNFTGTMILLKANQVLEARILVRCCWEKAYVRTSGPPKCYVQKVNVGVDSRSLRGC
jgi:hypothetical protein